LKQALAEKKEDLDLYTQRAEEDLAEFTDDQKKAQAQQEEDLKASIAARESEYQQYIVDLQGKIASVTQKHAEEEAEQLADLQLGLTRRTEEFTRYQQEIQDAMSAAVTNHAKQQADEEAELVASLARRREEHEKYEADTAAKIDAAVARHATQQTKEENALLASLENRRRELDRFEADTATRIDAAVDAHAAKQTKEENALLASLENRRRELDRFETDTATRIQSAIEAHAAQQAREEADLRTSLGIRRQEYESYKTDIQTKIGEILSSHAGLAESIGGLFTGILNDIGQLATRIVLEKIQGEVMGAFVDLLKKDGSIWKSITGLFDHLGDLFKKTKDAIIGVGQAGLDQLAGWGIGGGSNVPGAPGGSPGTGSPSGAAGAAGSGIAGVVGAIGSVATAISSIVGNFQMAGMNKTLDLIEKATRYSEIHLGYILDKTNAHLPKLNGMETFNYDTVAPAWYDLLSHLDNYLPRFATAFETDLPNDLLEIRTSIENTKGTIENMRDTLAEKFTGLVSGFGEKLATASTLIKAAIDLSASSVGSGLRDVINSDSTSRSSITSALFTLGSDVRNLQNAIFQTNASAAMLSELGMIRGELTSIKNLSQTQINAKPSQIVVNVQAPPATASAQNFGYVAGSALKSMGVF